MGIRDKSSEDSLASSTKATLVLSTSDVKMGENWTEMTPICRVLELCPRKALGSDIRFSCSGPQSTLWFGSLWFPRPLTFARWCLPWSPAHLWPIAIQCGPGAQKQQHKETAVGFRLDCVPPLAGGFLKCTLEHLTLGISDSRGVGGEWKCIFLIRFPGN